MKSIYLGSGFAQNFGDVCFQAYTKGRRFEMLFSTRSARFISITPTLTPEIKVNKAAGVGITVAASCRAAAAMMFADSAATGFARNASHWGLNGSSKVAMDVPFCLHTASRELAASLMIFESSRMLAIPAVVCEWDFLRQNANLSSF